MVDKSLCGNESLKAAVLAVTSIPIIMVYPFLQRYFIKGVTLGAVKSQHRYIEQPALR